METVTNKPPELSVIQINKMTNIQQLQTLEKTYDEFLDENIQILLLNGVLEDYLEIRDALTIRLSRLKRETKLRFYVNQYLLEE